MKTIIKSLGMTIKEFSGYYGIPYNTIRQWWNGDRTPPKWVIKLLNELIELKKNGEQIYIFHRKICYAVKIATNKHDWRTFYSEEDLEKAQNDIEFWKNQPQTISAELECWEKVF